MNNKILIALQYWEGDKAMAMKLARLIADLEPGRSNSADFLFAARYDCPHDFDTISYVSRKFDVHHFVCRRRGQMWPHGCNELWFGTIDWVYSHLEANRIPPYKAVLTCEADSCPLSPGWIEKLSASWDAAKTNLHGALLHYPGEHINGNGLFSCNKKYLHWIARQVGGCTPNGGWDYVLASQFKAKGWSNCTLMRSWWQKPTLSEEEFTAALSQGAAFLHGVKDESVQKLVREKYLTRA